jgi:hypothetical protein
MGIIAHDYILYYIVVCNICAKDKRQKTKDKRQKTKDKRQKDKRHFSLLGV